MTSDRGGIWPEERLNLLLAMERLSGRVEQALSQTARNAENISDHETRLRMTETELATSRDHDQRLAVLENEVATQRGKTIAFSSVAALAIGGGASLLVQLLGG
jgi:hypothetical protein